MNFYLRGTVITRLMLIVFMVSVLSGCGFRVSFNTNELRKEDASEFVVEKTAVEPVKSIDISTGTAEIELTQDDNYYVAIHYYYWEDAPDYSSEGGVIRFDDSNVFPDSYSITFNMNNYVKIYLPKDAQLDKINIRTASGDVSIADFLTDDLDVGVSYGDLSVKNASAKNASVNMSSGNGEFKDFNVQDLELDNSYGNITMSDINTGDIPAGIDAAQADMELSLSSGNCSIDSLTGRSMEISNSYGDISCKGVALGEFESDLSSGSLTMSKSTADSIDVDNSYGNATVSLNGSEEDYSLDLSTDYGKIKVDNTEYEKNLVREKTGNKSIKADLSSGDIELEFE